MENGKAEHAELDGIRKFPSEIEDMKKKIQHILNNLPLVKEEEIMKDIVEKLDDEVHRIDGNDSSSDIEEYRPLEAKNTSDYWPKFRIEKGILENRAMAHFQLSYDILNDKLKLCLLCLSIFPENSVIKVKSLIYLWIGEGIVTQEGDKTAEEVAKLNCKELINVGMINPVNKNSISELDSCTIHPWIQHMLRSVARKAGLLDFDEKTGKLGANFTTSRRALLRGDSNISTGKYEDLLSIFNIDAQYLKFKREWFSKLKRIVVLQLGRWDNSAKYHIEVDDTEFLKGLRDQKQLRYLSLQGISRITDLPNSIGYLINARILDLRACHNLEKLPSGLTSMKKLTHLDVSECYLLEFMPKGLHHLLELQVLKGFVISDSKIKDSCKLADLAKLKNLRKLSIYVGCNATEEEKEFQPLKLFSSLRILRITWGKVPAGSSHDKSSTGNLTMSSQSQSGPPHEIEELEVPQPMKTSHSVPPQEFKNLEAQQMRKSQSIHPPEMAKSGTQKIRMSQAIPAVESEISDLQHVMASQSSDSQELKNLKLQRQTSQSFPPQELEKLELRCFPRPQAPGWLTPGELNTLKKLYLRGGTLQTLGLEHGIFQTVKFLRLMYLKNLTIEWLDLLKAFPNSMYIEKVECKMLNSFPEEGVCKDHR